MGADFINQHVVFGFDVSPRLRQRRVRTDFNQRTYALCCDTYSHIRTLVGFRVVDNALRAGVSFASGSGAGDVSTHYVGVIRGHTRAQPTGQYRRGINRGLQPWWRDLSVIDLATFFASFNFWQRKCCGSGHRTSLYCAAHLARPVQLGSTYSGAVGHLGSVEN